MKISDHALDLEIGTYRGQESGHAKDVYAALVELKERRKADSVTIRIPYLPTNEEDERIVEEAMMKLRQPL